MNPPSASSPDPRPLVIWRFFDGKPGHENQTGGLVQALQAHRAVEAHDIAVPNGIAATAAWLLWWFPWGDDLPDPDLLLGAGHATHFPMLAARRARGGRTVVLMKPSLPCSWFDLCVVPLHDAPRPTENSFITRGVLNRIRPGMAKDPRKGLILIGGPSKHHGWSQQSIIEQLQNIQARSPSQQRWVLTSSRRTPAGFIAVARTALDPARIEIVPYEDTDADWLPEQLAWASSVWVSADSVSMIYETLTAGAAVGLLEVPAQGHDRIVSGVEALIGEGLVTSYSNWAAGSDLAPPKQPFSEAARCAREIVQRWYNDA